MNYDINLKHEAGFILLVAVIVNNEERKKILKMVLLENVRSYGAMGKALDYRSGGQGF